MKIKNRRFKKTQVIRKMEILIEVFKKEKQMWQEENNTTINIREQEHRHIQDRYTVIIVLNIRRILF